MSRGGTAGLGFPMVPRVTSVWRRVGGDGGHPGRGVTVRQRPLKWERASRGFMPIEAAEDSETSLRGALHWA